MNDLKSAVRWLFGDSAGHFAIAVVMLCACAVGVALKVEHSLEGCAALGLVVVTKLKS